MSAFVVVDLETTSREPAEAHIVEWAALVIEPPWFGEGGMREIGGLVRPPIPIPPETSAVHHIIDADVAKAPTWEEEAPRLVIALSEPGVIAVAHNANYERTLLSPLVCCQWLCTYKAALRIWPDAPGHSNETLRYWLGLGTGRSGLQMPHSAMHDAQVTAQILAELLKSDTKIEDMLRWTDEPALLPRCPIGEYRDLPWAEVPSDFLQWCIYKARNMREDIIFCARTELERREKARREALAAPSAAATEE